MFLRSKFGRKKFIGRDMSREAESYSLPVRLASACFKLITLELAILKHLYARWNMQPPVWFVSLRDCFSLKRQIVNIQLGHGIFHGYIARTAIPVMSPKKQSNSGTNARWIYTFWFTIHWDAPESQNSSS